MKYKKNQLKKTDSSADHAFADRRFFAFIPPDTHLTYDQMTQHLAACGWLSVYNKEKPHV